jgi:peptide subunit release factor 1 (eRF1)
MPGCSSTRRAPSTFRTSVPNARMTGTQSQIEWAEQIRPRVDAEFSRVAKAFHDVADRQPAPARIDTLAIIGILEEKRFEELAHEDAGYFITHWQELSDQVRLMIARYQMLKAKRG